MTITFRAYHHPHDYDKIDAFLIHHYRPGNTDGNWIEPMWEYMHFHPLLDVSSLGKIGVWEDAGGIVAVAHYEGHLGEAFFQFHPAYRRLREGMLDYVERHLLGGSPGDGGKYLRAYVGDDDEDFLALLKTRGYERDEGGTRSMHIFEIAHPFPGISLPDGFRLKSLADDPDWGKVNRVLWRGFDHGAEPPTGQDEIVSRRKMFDTPKARRNLKIVVESPGGDFVAFCGMFYEPAHRYAYVEPVATDPDYRRMGLGKAAVLEGIRRCAALGATVAYVGNDLPIYRAIGFKKVYDSECWLKYFSEA
jgi:GNAT superfamily N-acetyltransferase